MVKHVFSGPDGPNSLRKRVILMKTTRLIVLLLIVLLVIAMAASTQAAKAGGRKAQGMAAGDQQAAGMTPDQRRAHMAAMAPLQRILMPPPPQDFLKFGIALNLTDAQKEQVKALYHTFGDALKGIGPGRGEALKGVLTLLQQPTPNKGDLQAGAARVLDGDKAIIDAEFDFWIGLKGILNAQQNTALGSYMQNKAMGEMAGGRHGGPGGPPPPQ